MSIRFYQDVTKSLLDVTRILPGFYYAVIMTVLASYYNLIKSLFRFYSDFSRIPVGLY